MEEFNKYEKFGAYHWKNYSKKSNAYDKFYRNHVDYIIESFRNRKKGTLLDVGCGDGLITCLLRWDNFEAEGIDIDKKGIELAKKKCLVVEFKIRDVFEETRRFDYLLASEIIEHLPNPDEFLKKVKSLFKEEALITTTNRTVHLGEIGPHHFKEYNENEFKSLLEKHFKKVRVEVTGGHLYGWVKL